MAAAAAPLHPQVDMELKKAFEDLQIKMLHSRNQMKQITGQVEQHKRSIQHAKLTEAELAPMADSIRMYEGIGRMFALSEKSKIMTGLAEKTKANEKKIESMEKNREYLEKTLKDSENSLREMIQTKQGKK